MIAPPREPAGLQTGSPLRPEGEKHNVGHADTIGEASPTALANRARKRATSTTSPSGESGTAGSLGGAIHITRATARILIEPWRLAVDSKAHAERRCGGKTTCRACDLLAALREARDAAVWAANVAVRRLWLSDATALEAAKARAVSAGVMFRSADWSPPELNVYQIVREAAPALATSSAATVSSRIFRKWRQVRWNVLVRQTEAPPHFRQSMPLPIRADCVRLSRTEDATAYTFGFSVHPGRHAGGAEFRLPIIARDEYQTRVLHALTGSDVKIGDAAIEQDRKRPSRWYVRFAYKRQVAAPPATGAAAGINRGLVCFLAAVTSNKETWIYDGDDIRAYLAHMQRRRQRFQRQVKASARVGHGRSRALKPIEHLEAKAERWRQTRCQVIARRFVKWLAERGVVKLYIEDFSGIRDREGLTTLSPAAKELIMELVQEWPYYQLQQRIESCCAEAGIRVVAVSMEGKPAQTCPNCGHMASENMDLARRMFRCVKCKFRRHLDVATSMTVIQHGAHAEAETEVKA